MVELSKRKEGNPLRWEIVEDMERGREREAGGEVEEEAERERDRDYCVVILSFSPTSAHPE